ncbi:MAG: hypothetical protein BGO31_02435 [Bacteroidetes bacterium 43-16]|nr:MAG: hypothetical protein BGO31_02435 [Bacteroidetes bacterium 43-16]
MSEQAPNRNLLSSTIWTIVQSFGTQIVTILITAFLSRIVTPEETGFIAMVAFVTSIAQLVIDSGLESSLMRKYENKDADYNSVFIYNLVSSVAIYLLIVLCAPLIANYFEEPRLVPIIRVFSVTIIIVAITSVQKVQLEKSFNFKPITFIAIVGNITSGLLGLFLAYNGFGVWSLVAISICTPVLTMVYLWYKSPWRPNFKFDKEVFRQHFRFGYKVALSTILLTIFSGIYNVIIGKKYSAGLVGQYNRANQLAMMIAFSIGGAINRIALPLFASKSTDVEELKTTYLRVLRMLMFVMAPIATFCTIAAPAIINFLFGGQWGTAIGYFQILASVSVLYSLNMISLYVINITGRSELGLKADIFKKTISIILIFIAAIGGDVYALIWVNILILLIELIISFKYCTFIIKSTVWEQVKTLLPCLMVSVLSALPLYFLYHFLNTRIEHSFLLLAATLPVFGIVYLVLSWLIPNVGLKDFLQFTKIDQKLPARIIARLK